MAGTALRFRTSWSYWVRIGDLLMAVDTFSGRPTDQLLSGFGHPAITRQPIHGNSVCDEMPNDEVKDVPSLVLTAELRDVAGAADVNCH